MSNSSQVEENPGWVRKCAEAFKKDKCMLTHEMRTIDNWRRFNHRVDASPYKAISRAKCPSCDSIRRSRKPEPCTCHELIQERLPELNPGMFPSELWGPPEEAGASGRGAGEMGRKRKAGAVGAGAAGGARVKKEPGGDEVDDQATALLGDEGLAPIKLTNEELKRGEEDGPGNADKEAGGGAGSDKGEGEDGEDDDGDDMEDADYGAGDRYDDDDDLTNDDGEASDNEEARYGTY